MRKITKKQIESAKFDIQKFMEEQMQEELEKQISKAYGLPNNTVSTFSNSNAFHVTQEDVERWKKEFEELNKKYSGGIYGNPIPYSWNEVFPEPKFPEPNYDIIPSYNPMTGEQKEYWLPALKVLNWNEIIGWFVSPSRPAIWANDELEYEFVEANYGHGLDYRAYEFERYQDGIHPFQYKESGIYGGMVLEEIGWFLGIDTPNGYFIDPSYDLSCRRLCIIEPFPDADVVICEQGWRAKKAFISEIVGETIDVDTVSNLLSIAWNRKIDVRGLYENWKDNQSNSISEA